MQECKEIWYRLGEVGLINKTTELKNLKGIGMGIGIFLLSILLLGVMSGFKQQLFLIDDNLNQWHPIMEKAFETFFKTGRMPIYDFYQWKGLEIADQGYYSLFNPIMLISFALHKFILRLNALSTISIYIYIMFALGNTICYALCRKLNASIGISMLIVLMYSSCATFVRFGYWYYVYNNYFIVPLLIYAILTTKDRKSSYFSVGIILAFSIILGNVQYSVYQFLAYCIFMACIALIDNKKYFINIISNCIIGIALSIPTLIILLQSAQRSNIYTSQKEFYAMPLSAVSCVIMSFVPNALIAEISPELSRLIGGFSRNVLFGNSDSYISFVGGFAVCLATLIILLVKKLVWFTGNNRNVLHEKVTLEMICDWNKKYTNYISNKYAENYFRALYISTFFTIYFFYSFATGGLVAIIFSFIPLINSFRYLFKTFFILSPFFIIVAVLAFNVIKKKKLLMVVCVLLSLVGCINNYFIIRSFLPSQFERYITKDIETSIINIKEEIKENNIDIANYRISSFIDPKYVGETGIGCSFDLNNKIIRNIGTRVGVFTLGGQDNTSTEKSFNQSSHILDDAWLAGYGNTALASTIVSTAIHKPDILKKEINANALKYFIFDKGSTYVEQFISAVNNIPGLSVTRIFDFMDGCVMVEIGGVNSLCYNTNFSDLNNTIDAEMDKLSFEVEGGSEYRLSFTYKDNLYAQFISYDGTITKQLDITEDENGYILINTQDVRDGIVTLSYKNVLVDISKLFSIVVTVLFVIVIGMILRIEDDEKEEIF